MGFADLQDLVQESDGSLVSTGFHPRADLISDRARPPRRWCWLVFTTASRGEGATLPRLLVGQGGSPAIAPILLGPVSRAAPPLLLRLPDHVSSLQLLPGNAPGPTNIAGVRITEVGKLRLLATLMLEDPRAAWRAYRATPSFAHFKTKLIETRQARQLSTGGPDWLHVYASGEHPGAITFDGGTSFAIVLDAAGARAANLDAAMASLMAQTYPRWQLVVRSPADPAAVDVLRQWTARSSAISVLGSRAARKPSSNAIESDEADYILFMDADTVLEPHALARFAAAAAAEDADMVYGDGILTEQDGRYIALNALPVFSHESYLRSPRQFGPIVLRGAVLPTTDGRDLWVRTDDVAMILGALEHRLRIVHVPDVLFRSWPAHRAAASQHRVAEAAAHLRRLGYADAVVAPAGNGDVFAVRRHARHDGKVLAIVPTKNRRALLETCVASLGATTRTGQVDIVIVDHESTEADTLAYLDQVSRSGVKVLRHGGPFNYSTLNNAAVSRFGGGYPFYLFLNNDIEAETEGWLDAMLDLVLQPDVGVVGATLLYPDRRIQHAGVVVGMVGAAEHAYRFARLDDYLHLRQGPHLTRQYSAVTGACMLVSAAAFSAVGGFDEKLAVGFNDIDLCLRIGATGHRILQCAEAVLVHHESASRGKSHDGRDPHPDDTRLFYDRHARILEEGDPFFSPLLDPTDALFVPRPLVSRQSHLRLRAIVHDAPLQRL
ncbi:glycosyltransferase [Lichenihabitans sp. Uapishka_5]|uniref:glycosyltransferase family 2 protein n=1 Tax=Lichenihabitans sp. Uapishka_5 TaxID=3037302 RepID=UPI0029E7D1B0|nr:glycosyltransferase [Lichenihabitans sp. Uapishka_5]MDX7952825.1 glycosyltransferase [Lichenihabitans sp. Uapishka_5]